MMLPRHRLSLDQVRHEGLYTNAAHQVNRWIFFDAPLRGLTDAMTLRIGDSWDYHASLVSLFILANNSFQRNDPQKLTS